MTAFLPDTVIEGGASTIALFALSERGSMWYRDDSGRYVTPRLVRVTMRALYNHAHVVMGGDLHAYWPVTSTYAEGCGTVRLMRRLA